MKCCNGIFILCGLYTENMTPDTIGFIATVITCKFAFTQFNYFTGIHSKLQSVWLYVAKQKKNSSDAYIVSVMKLKACENVIVVILSFIM